MINCSILIRESGERNFRIIRVRPHPELALPGAGAKKTTRRKRLEENGGRIVSGCSRLNAQYNLSDCGSV